MIPGRTISASPVTRPAASATVTGPVRPRSTANAALECGASRRTPTGKTGLHTGDIGSGMAVTIVAVSAGRKIAQAGRGRTSIRAIVRSWCERTPAPGPRSFVSSAACGFPTPTGPRQVQHWALLSSCRMVALEQPIHLYGCYGIEITVRSLFLIRQGSAAFE